jgi:hypothetical protein
LIGVGIGIVDSIVRELVAHSIGMGLLGLSGDGIEYRLAGVPFGQGQIDIAGQFLLFSHED